MEKIKIELQYFNGCPSADYMLKIIDDLKNRYSDKAEFVMTLVDTPQKAHFSKFRGSPTLLINGKDAEGMPEPLAPSLACRYYPNGLPELEDIEQIINELL